jgi:hypothetical protein
LTENSALKPDRIKLGARAVIKTPPFQEVALVQFHQAALPRLQIRAKGRAGPTSNTEPLFQNQVFESLQSSVFSHQLPPVTMNPTR